MQPLVWVVVLLALGLVVMVLEVFLPSGGVLGFLSVMAIIASVGMAFLEVGPLAGLGVMAAACVAVPAVLATAFRWFPETPLGRRVLPPPPSPADVVPAADRRARLRGLAGRRGRTLTELVPWGLVEIDGERCDAVSEGGPIAAGETVEVARVEGTALVVRVAAAATVPHEPPARPAPPAESAPTGLSPTLESFDFDALGPPAT